MTATTEDDFWAALAEIQRLKALLSDDDRIRFVTLQGEISRLELALATAKHERDHARLQQGRYQARCSVFVNAIAYIARQRPEYSRWAKEKIEQADAAMKHVRLEDMVVAHLNSEGADG